MSSNGSSQLAATGPAPSSPGSYHSRSSDPDRRTSSDSAFEPPARQPSRSQSQHSRSPPSTPKSVSSSSNGLNYRHRDVEPREFVRLFQCHICSLPLREPICLPCGNNLCRRCLPKTHIRPNITYPAIADRLPGFRCPFPTCGREHALEDCAVDIVLNKAAQHVRDAVERSKADAADLPYSTRVALPDPWAAAGISSMRETDDYSRISKGGKVVATYSLAEDGALSFEADITYDQIYSTSSSPSPPPGCDFDDARLIRSAQEVTRPEMDCQVCYALFYDPITSACGHTFCRSCLCRILDHSRYCPICRRPMAINPILNHSACPPNGTVTSIIKAFWLEEVESRKEALEAERINQLQDFDFPLFVCTLAFPHMPTFLHIFEPRYRLMIRRALESNRLFGMVLPKRPQHANDTNFQELGTLLRIVNVQFYADGRSLIETVGISRFKILRHGHVDGYVVGKTERVDDVSLEEEEAMEAVETVSQQQHVDTTVTSDHDVDMDDDAKSEEESTSASSTPQSGSPILSPQTPRPDALTTQADIEAMSTQCLMEFATSFVRRMQEQSAPWLAERMLSIYGDCPDDAAIFPWWFASMLPVKEPEKYRLLGTSSVRERLKICCSWIAEWQTSRWIKMVDGRPGLSTAAQSSD